MPPEPEISKTDEVVVTNGEAVSIAESVPETAQNEPKIAESPTGESGQLGGIDPIVSVETSTGEGVASEPISAQAEAVAGATAPSSQAVMEMKAYANNLEKLRVGTLLRSLQKENEEPENIALDQVSKELRFLQRQWQYVAEIERVLKELRMTVFLIQNCKDGELPNGVNRQELLTYYQGVFLTLVHQMKDKLTKVVNLITEEEIPEDPSVEKDVKVSELLRKKQKLLQDIGIEEEMMRWDQENQKSGIAVALRKRTYHHHRVSGLRYDKNFLNLCFTDVVGQPAFQSQLTDYGKERIEKIRAESIEQFFVEVLDKAESTLRDIEANIEKVSEALVIYFKLPISQEEATKIIADQSAVLGSLEIINKSSLDKIPERYKTLLDELLKKIKEKHHEKVVAVYLVGSLGRGEYEEGYSDINIYIILNEDDSVGQISRHDFGLNLRVFTKDCFMSDISKKFRFIARADGVLLYGEDLTKDEKLPKAGLFLALELNDDILDILDEAMKWVEENPTATPIQISQKSRWLAKRLIDFIYGVAMSNKPQYTASRKERIERILEEFPERKVIDTLMGVTQYGVGELGSLKNMIEGFREKAETNLKRMQEVKIGIKKNKTKL